MVYSSKKEFTKALDYYKKALKIKEDIGDKRAVSIILSNIAQIYNDKNESLNALQYYERALKINEVVENNKGLIALMPVLEVFIKSKAIFISKGILYESVKYC